MARKLLALPARRQIVDDLRPDAPQGFIKIALDLLQRRLSVRRSAVHTLEAERETSVLQFEQRIVDQRVLECLLEFLKEAHAADTLTEKAAEHAVLRPDVAILGRDVLDDVASATCSIRLAKEARISATRSRPSSNSSGPAARMIGFSFGAASSSRRRSGARRFSSTGRGAAGVEIHSSVDAGAPATPGAGGAG
jgi:hypothetical protein